GFSRVSLTLACDLAQVPARPPVPGPPLMTLRSWRVDGWWRLDCGNPRSTLHYPSTLHRKSTQMGRITMIAETCRCPRGKLSTIPPLIPETGSRNAKNSPYFGITTNQGECADSAGRKVIMPDRPGGWRGW